MKKIPLAKWAAAHYDPPPTRWVLNSWVRRGEIYPPPERVGTTYYVSEGARRQTGAPVEPRPSLVDRLKAGA